MSRLNQPSRIRIYINTTELDQSEREYLSKQKNNYERAIKHEIDTAHLVLENTGAGTYFVKKLKDKFGNRVLAYAETPIEKSDLPEDIQEAKRWQTKLKNKNLTLKN